jgi:hypothetical protein
VIVQVFPPGILSETDHGTALRSPRHSVPPKSSGCIGRCSMGTRASGFIPEGDCRTILLLYKLHWSASLIAEPVEIAKPHGVVREPPGIHMNFLRIDKPGICITLRIIRNRVCHYATFTGGFACSPVFSWHQWLWFYHSGCTIPC